MPWSPTMDGSLHEQSLPNNESAGAVFNSGMADPPVGSSYSAVTFTIKGGGSDSGTISFKHADTDGTILATSETYDTSQITTSYKEITLNFLAPITISANQGVVCDNTSNDGTITLKANTSTSTSNYSSCQGIPTYAPVGGAAIGNYIEITLGSGSTAGTRLPPPPIVVHF